MNAIPMLFDGGRYMRPALVPVMSEQLRRDALEHIAALNAAHGAWTPVPRAGATVPKGWGPMTWRPDLLQRLERALGVLADAPHAPVSVGSLHRNDTSVSMVLLPLPTAWEDLREGTDHGDGVVPPFWNEAWWNVGIDLAAALDGQSFEGPPEAWRGWCNGANDRITAALRRMNVLLQQTLWATGAPVLVPPERPSAHPFFNGLPLAHDTPLIRPPLWTTACILARDLAHGRIRPAADPLDDLLSAQVCVVVADRGVVAVGSSPQHPIYSGALSSAQIFPSSDAALAFVKNMPRDANPMVVSVSLRATARLPHTARPAATGGWSDRLTARMDHDALTHEADQDRPEGKSAPRRKM